VIWLPGGAVRACMRCWVVNYTNIKPDHYSVILIYNKLTTDSDILGNSDQECWLAKSMQDQFTSCKDSVLPQIYDIIGCARGLAGVVWGLPPHPLMGPMRKANELEGLEGRCHSLTWSLCLNIILFTKRTGNFSLQYLRNSSAYGIITEVSWGWMRHCYTDILGQGYLVTASFIM